MTDYTRELKSLQGLDVRFQSQVTSMRKQILGPGASEEWLIDTVDLKTTHRQTETFDAPVVATGHYNDPFVRRNARSLDRQTSD